MASSLVPAASSGSFLISPNGGLMIWTLLLFGISMYVLAKLAFPRITEALDRRQKAIENSIDAAHGTPGQVNRSPAFGYPGPLSGLQDLQNSTGITMPFRWL